MDTTIYIGDKAYTVSSDEELAMMKDAVDHLQRERECQKRERDQALTDIMEAIANYVENFGLLLIGNSMAEIFIDGNNLGGVSVGYRNND